MPIFLMKILISIMPGAAFACALFFFLISGSQFYIYRKKSYQRSKAIALFCFFSGLFTLESFIAQSRIFSPTFTHFYVTFSTTCLTLSLFYYIKALSFFIAIPNRLFRFFKIGFALLSGAAFLTLPAFLLSETSLCFDPSRPLYTGNYFVDSYSTRIGTPHIFMKGLLSLSGILTILATSTFLRLVLKTSKDRFFIVGLIFSVFGALFENFLLPFTFAYFVPIIFLSNFFEAFRMHVLAGREYRKEKGERSPLVVPNEQDRYQNSNLSEERIQYLALQITDLLKNQKIYTNPNLHSEDLAKKVGIPAYQLSQVINIGLQTTFFELLSFYRIEHVKKQLRDEALLSETIINIAYNSGFNSKSAFNTAFKRQTGMTPSHFRRTHEV